MSNEHEEVEVVETEEVEVTEDESTETETEVEPTTEGVKEVKPTETLEDRKARLERQLAQTNKKLGVDVEKPDKKSSKKSDEFGYDVKAYLKASGIKANEFDFVKQEAGKSGMDIDSLLENEYFQAKLEKFRNLEKTASATPKGTRSGSPATDSVDYWMTKPIEDVPADMRIKVVNAKLKKEKENKGIFYNS